MKYALLVDLLIVMQFTDTKEQNMTLDVMKLENNCSFSDYTQKARCFVMRCEDEETLLEICTDAIVVCDGGLVRQLLTNSNVNITNLQIRNWSGQCLDFSTLQKLFPDLRQLMLYRAANLRRIWGKFDENSKIQHLILREVSALLELPASAVQRMSELRVLDLRKNGIQHLNRDVLIGPPKLHSVYLTENRWHCSDGGLDWVAMEKDNGTARKRIKDFDRLMCHQRLYKGKPMSKVMKFIKYVSETCPSPCICNLTYVGLDSNGHYVPIATVDCSHKGLTEPPASMPLNTKTLRLEGNKISSVRMLVQNPHYRKISELYLDNNTISNLKELEGSEWLTTFHIFSLRQNQLSQIPLFAFDSALQKNADINGGGLFLGDNPYRCDCHYTPLFQDFLRKYGNKVIIDMKEIQCAQPMGRYFKISSMPVREFCFNNQLLYLHPVKILNIILGLLIFILVSKFVYDYYKYKRTGQLPWLSKIMP